MKPRDQADELNEVADRVMRRSFRGRWWAGVTLAVAAVAGVLPACGTEFKAAPSPGNAGAAGIAGEDDPRGGSSSGNAGSSSGNAGSSSGNAGSSSGGSAGASPSGGALNGSGGEGGHVGGQAGEGGSDGPGGGGAGGQNAAPSCDPEALSEGCTLAADAGIFVSPDGDDDANGHSTRPLRSITEAVERAGSLSQPVPIFVCSAAYDENVSIRSDGVALHGGFECPSSSQENWVYDSAERARIAPTTAGPALRVRDVEGLIVSNFVMQARHAGEPDESSVAAFVSDSEQVVFRSVRLIAGQGADGSAGVLEPAPYVAPSELAGNSASGTTGGPARTDCGCDAPTSDSSQGGKGGDGGLTASPGTAGYPLGRGGGGAGQVQQCSTGGTGGRGTDAPVGGDGSGAESLGSVTSSGWLPESGLQGQHGLPGQGGGGGGGSVGVNVGGGGGGACGGCGGHGAGGGRGGGASIGLVSLDSSIELESSSIETDRAGNGGAGSAGQPGQEGGAGGTPTGMGCPGGAGGKGADGAASGGGAGGISVGIVWRGGEQPDLPNSDITFDEAGTGGLGGKPGVNDGIPGISKRVHAAE